MSLTLGIFVVILLITVAITYWAAKRTSTTADFYAADSGLTAAQNGFALAGDWCSAAAFLGFTGLTALYGMDGAFYALGPLVAFCTVLFLIAEPMRNAGIRSATLSEAACRRGPRFWPRSPELWSSISPI